ncbi:MAG: GNAT family N-acetyltransferase [Acidaminobacteraceae bacterium]
MEENLYRLRLADESDMDFYYEIYQQEDVRENSFNYNKITLEEHRKWFVLKLSSELYEFYVCEYKNQKSGLLRIELTYEKDMSYGLISFSVKSEFQGKGIGTFILKKASDLYSLRKLELHGEVKKENISSHRAFIKAGYSIFEESIDKIVYRTNI